MPKLIVLILGMLVCCYEVAAQGKLSEEEMRKREEQIRKEQEDGWCRCKLPPTANSKKAEAWIERAKPLLDQGNILVAREKLNAAVDEGNADTRFLGRSAGADEAADAMFMLAETYDPYILPKWVKDVSTYADVPKARVLYSKALADGVRDAAARIRALQNY